MDLATMTSRMPTIQITEIDTPLGTMTCGTTASDLVLLEFDDPARLQKHMNQLRLFDEATFRTGKTDLSHLVEQELEAYFAGELNEFTVPIRTSGTPFQTAVWEEIRRIPFGSILSYSEQAQRMGMPRAVRAVASANGRNRIAIIIPCHRIIGVGGRLSGYGGGLWRKRRLLELEGAEIQLGLTL